MGPRYWYAVLGVAAVLALAPAPKALGQQQQNPPRIGYAYPAGGRQGATVQMVVGGQFLDGVTDARVSGAGVRATVIEHIKPLTPQQANLLRDQLKELMDKKAAAGRGGAAPAPRTPGAPGAARKVLAETQPAAKPAWTAADEKTLAEIRKKLATFVRRPSSPAIAETVTLEVTLAADAAPGERELRLQTPAGLTNPLVFCVGQLPEFAKPPAKRSGEPTGSGAEPDLRLPLPVVANGQITPGGADRYRFAARQGQRLVIAARARELIPYIADAVPGWFQVSLALYDGQGHELTYADHYRFHPDPVLYFEVPRDGEYVVEIRDSIYRGREDFVYRLTIGEVPFITSIYPLGGPAGAVTTVELKGWNLPVSRVTMDAKDKPPGVYPLSVRLGELASNRVPFAVDALPECAEQEPNDQPASAQAVTLPIIVNGRIDKPGDCDVFRFSGRAGDQIVAEVVARRLGSPLDSVLKLTDAAGKQLACNDDCEDKGAGLDTHYADSYLTAKLPADGTYYLHLADVQHHGGPDYAYRLRLGPPRPDFALRIVPSGLNVRSGATVPITVHALRHDGFTGEITLALRNAPAGFALAGARVPANQDQVRLTLTAPFLPAKGPLDLTLEGHATIAGRDLVHPAVPAEDMMQAFAYRHLVPAQEWVIEVATRGGSPRAPVRILSALPLKIPAGGTARLLVGVATGPFMGAAQFELSDPPAGLAIQRAAPGRDGTDIVFTADAAKLKPGLQGNLILQLFTERQAPAGAAAAANRRRLPLGTLPAIPFEIVAP